MMNEEESFEALINIIKNSMKEYVALMKDGGRSVFTDRSIYIELKGKTNEQGNKKSA